MEITTVPTLYQLELKIVEAFGKVLTSKFLVCRSIIDSDYNLSIVIGRVPKIRYTSGFLGIGKGIRRPERKVSQIANVSFVVPDKIFIRAIGTEEESRVLMTCISEVKKILSDDAINLGFHFSILSPIEIKHIFGTNIPKIKVRYSGPP